MFQEGVNGAAHAKRLTLLPVCVRQPAHRLVLLEARRIEVLNAPRSVSLLDVPQSDHRQRGGGVWHAAGGLIHVQVLTAKASYQQAEREACIWGVAGKRGAERAYCCSD